MESLEEILKVVGGLIVGAIYLFGNQIFKSKDEDKPEQPTQPRESASSDDDAARQRQIQEAIRRKIMQRRQATATATSSAEPASAHRERHKQVVEQHKETHQRAPHVERTPEASEVDDRFSWDTSDNVYDEQMQARLEQIQATKRRAEVLRHQAGRSTTKVKQARSTGGGFPAGSVRSVLRDPAVARTAFVYGEVLGKPVGLRPSGTGVD
jgi:FtsZ-interacting cell division protein ZipA